MHPFLSGYLSDTHFIFFLNEQKRSIDFLSIFSPLSIDFSVPQFTHIHWRPDRQVYEVYVYAGYLHKEMNSY